jgi:hypothetical protein
MGLCKYYERESQNVRNKGMCCNQTVWDATGECVQQVGEDNPGNNEDVPGPNSYAECVADSERLGKWVEFGRFPHSWPPLCERSPFSRDNHLGNSVPKAAESGSLDAISRAPQFEWSIPTDALRDPLDGKERDEVTCVLRMRYNISTMDFPGWGIHASDGKFTDAKHNGGDAPLKNNPEGDFVGVEAPVEVGTNYPLQLNINTNQ